MPGAHVFEKAVDFVLKFEGGWVDHPEDPGGETNMGITLETLRSVHREAGTEELKALTRAQAISIYKTLYWIRPKIDTLPVPIAVFVFDGAVQHGPMQSIKFLQRACVIKADGVIGPVTQSASSIGRPIPVIESMYSQRENFYRSLKNFPTFGRGWLRRLADIRELSIEMAKTS